ncbi:tail fiber domain-containing protein [Portibacter lacus]|uniref:Peptidase S74 domain-containing protein n=1 Tax=Portibacter lacus TaxID=1099794 RepID=A0AA37SN69_9BACT|nr:tail fiber domain-containing protein [Portibacter lacus]GLR16489.1 hypothetical protein GCM10007940_11040 [Portibacter lacus]
MYAFQYITSSDATLKENLRPINDALAKIMQINPMIYDFKPEVFQGASEDKMQELQSGSTNQYGVIAQELEKIYPDLVKVDKDNGLYGVNYQGLIPVLIKALQEQQVAISELSAKISKLKNGE